MARLRFFFFYERLNSHNLITIKRNVAIKKIIALDYFILFAINLIFWVPPKLYNGYHPWYSEKNLANYSGEMHRFFDKLSLDSNMNSFTKRSLKRKITRYAEIPISPLMSHILYFSRERRLTV